MLLRQHLLVEPLAEPRLFRAAGRGGSCELMIGSVAKATSDEVNFDRDEMDDVRWVTRQEAASALRVSEQKANPYLGAHGPSHIVCTD